VENLISLLFFGVLFFDGIHHRPFLFLVFWCFCPCGQKTFLFDLFLFFDLSPALIAFNTMESGGGYFLRGSSRCLYRKVGREKM
jgi:hypothetical protein